jgi:hypothetical protein
MTQNMEMICDKSPPEVVTKDILPYVYTSFNINRVDVINAILLVIPKIIKHIPHQDRKQIIIPRVQVPQTPPHSA